LVYQTAAAAVTTCSSGLLHPQHLVIILDVIELSTDYFQMFELSLFESSLLSQYLYVRIGLRLPTALRHATMRYIRQRWCIFNKNDYYTVVSNTL